MASNPARCIKQELAQEIESKRILAGGQLGARSS
jgi:hypothetical protein